MTAPFPAPRSLDEALHKIEALVESVRQLTVNVENLLRFRRWSSAALTVLFIGGLVGTLLYTNHQRAAVRRASCQAVNGTNSVLQNLLNSAQVAAPKTPPANASAVERREFWVSKSRADSFYADTRIQLAPKAC